MAPAAQPSQGFARPKGAKPCYITGAIISLQLDDAEATALTALLTNTVEVDRYPLSARVQTFRDILAKLQAARAQPSRKSSRCR